jgi:hypothetical protein
MSVGHVRSQRDIPVLIVARDKYGKAKSYLYLGDGVSQPPSRKSVLSHTPHFLKSYKRNYEDCLLLGNITTVGWDYAFYFENLSMTLGGLRVDACACT